MSAATLVTTSEDGQIRVYDYSTYKLLDSYTLGASINRIRYAAIIRMSDA